METARRVLIAVDTSKWSEAAFDWYVENIHQPNTEVVCLHSLEQPDIVLAPGRTFTVSADVYAEALETSKALGKSVEDKFTKKLKDAHIPGKMIAKFGSKPGEDIVKLAESENVTMIIMGTRGAGTVRRTILGSVSDYVVHHAPCPVAVCCHHHLHRH